MKKTDNKTCKNSSQKISVLFAFGLVAVFLGLFGLVHIIDNILPTPLYLSDEETYPESFITERAQQDLKILTDIGPREAGSYESEVLAVTFLQRQINSIIKNAHKSYKIELDIQNVSSFFNFTNIVVKLYGKINSSVLVNAHFDSFGVSPGGSDDGINCVVMLEVLRKITQKPQEFLNSLIFLFNGAEEMNLMGAAAFIKRHKWAKDCKVVVNLDSMGAGGKIILFQTGPEASWLVEYYKSVPHPCGQAAGEEIFQSGFIPSGTDFSVFRAFGKLVGLDMAFFKDGYRYHTKYDGFDNIPLGSYQHVGDNVLHLVKNLGNAPEVANPKKNSVKSVYFDFLGFFMISYNNTVGIVINSIVGSVSIAIFVLTLHSFKLGSKKNFFLCLAKTFGAIIGGWFLAGIFNTLLALFIDSIGYSMSWYMKPWLIFGLYTAPTIVFETFLLLFIKQKDLSSNVKVQIQAHSVRIIWTFVMIFGTIFNIRSVYIILVPVLFNTLGFIVIYGFKLQHTIVKWQIVYLISLVLPTMFLMYATLLVMTVFIPLTADIQLDINVELFIGLQGFIYTTVITSPFAALVTLVRKFRYLLFFLCGVFIINFITIFTPLVFSYSSNPNITIAERYWNLHGG